MRQYNLLHISHERKRTLGTYVLVVWFSISVDVDAVVWYLTFDLSDGLFDRTIDAFDDYFYVYKMHFADGKKRLSGSSRCSSRGYETY
jgi:hypothetical protein